MLQALAEVATMVARALYLQADGDAAQLNNIVADPKMVSSSSVLVAQCAQCVACSSDCLSSREVARSYQWLCTGLGVMIHSWRMWSGCCLPVEEVGPVSLSIF